MHCTVESEYTLEQFMTALITAGLTYSTEISMLKTAHSKSFSGGSVKIKIFILQMDNKIADAAEILKERKIRYRISLLRGPAAE